MENFNKEYRKKSLITSIKRDKKEIGADTAKLAGAALLIGASAIGVYFLGPEVLEKYSKWITGETALTFKSDFLLRLKASGVVFSIVGIGAGITVAISKIKDIVRNIKNINFNQSNFAELENEEKGRTL